jgi:hypothetical protein
VDGKRKLLVRGVPKAGQKKKKTGYINLTVTESVF